MCILGDKLDEAVLDTAKYTRNTDRLIMRDWYQLWQYQVIKHYSVAYFDCVTTFEALLCNTSVKGGAHMGSEAASMPDKST